MRRFLIILCLCLLAMPAAAQTTVAYWAQNDNDLPEGGFGFAPGSFPQPADIGNGSISLNDFDTELDDDGVYVWIGSFGGTTQNAINSAPAGGSLSPRGGSDTSNNGMSIDIAVDTSGFEGIRLSWAQRGTGSGFDSRAVSWSDDGGSSFAHFDTDSGALGSSWSTVEMDFSAIESLNDNAEVVFRITLDGATGSTGNNRLDNILVQGFRPSVYSTDFSSDPFASGWQDQNLQGPNVWGWSENFANVSFSAFDGTSCAANDNWLISPVIDLAGAIGTQLTFDVARGFGSVNGLEVYLSSDYDGSSAPESATWQLLTTVVSDDFSSNNQAQQFGPFNELDTLDGTAHVAFRYASDDGSNCLTWRVAGLRVDADEIDNDSFACGAAVTRIHSVQGQGFSSPLAGQNVEIEAIVIGDFQQTANGGLGGFYLQEADVDQDDNPLTSEGVFVHDNGFGVPVSLGDRVRVAGTVAEHFGETRISPVSQVAVCASDRLADTSPVPLTLPVSDMIEFEALEGMWVRLPQTLTVTDVFNVARFGEFAVSSRRLYQPTQVVAPGEDAVDLQEANSRNRLLIDDGRDGANRLPFITGLDGINELSADNPVRNGYQLQRMFEGVMAYGFSNYRMHPLTLPRFAEGSNPRPGPILRRTSANLRMGTFNVENLFTTLQTGGVRCGPNALTCRGATSVSELERQIAKLSSSITALDADVLALIEVENDDDDATLAFLVDALNDFDPGSSWDYVPTGYLGSDAIKPAFIYQADRLSPIGATAVLDSSVDPDFDTSRQRPALAQSFIMDNGARFTAVALHLRAKACGGASEENADQGDGQGCWNAWRTESAGALARWLETHPTGISDSHIALLGDFNAYAQEDPMTTLYQAGYSNVAIASNDDNPAIYSYVFMGQAGSLDHGLVSASLLQRMLQARAWPINADETRAFDYTEGELPGGFVDKPESFYTPGPVRSSDHDPLVIDFNLLSPGELIFKDAFEQ